MPSRRLTFILCREGLGCVKQEKNLTNESSTLRRHAASLHSVSLTILNTLFYSNCLFHSATLPEVVRRKQVRVNVT
jgi:hypothetical protein